MAKVEIKLNSAGVKEMLQSQELKQICEEHANKALSKLGAGYSVSSMTGKTRVNASILAESHEARRANLEDNIILKALR